jgi:hypothetical protein
MADLSITAANVRLGSDAVTQLVQFGEAVTPGQPVYLSSSKYYKADADDANKYEATAIAMSYASTDDYGLIQLKGSLDIGATTVEGTVYVLSDTAGGIKPTADLVAGDYTTILMVATDAAGNCELAIQAFDATKA